MTDSGKNESSSAQDNASADTAALPFYRRPWFWGGLLLLAIIMLALWLAWREWQNAEARRLALEAELAQTRQANEAREAFLAQLRALLQKDPCVIQEELMRLTPPPGIIWPP
ncbi:MAG: serine protease, partial [Desulfovibrionaceae bacterium]|nr:serine protease [Desulfovibrionaceae bacterium]